MAYEYAVDGETYTGRTGRMSSPRLIGTVITVKYNPEVPEENTAILSPNTHNLLVLLILGTAIAVVGFFPLWGAGATSQPSAKDAHRGAEEIGSGDRHGI